MLNPKRERDGGRRKNRNEKVCKINFKNLKIWGAEWKGKDWTEEKEGVLKMYDDEATKNEAMKSEYLNSYWALASKGWGDLRGTLKN